MKDLILKIYGTDYKENTKRLLESYGLTELILEKCQKDCRIGIKPNLVSPTPADFGATTHPEVVAGIIEYLNEHDIKNIVILEGSWVGDKTEDAFEYCGYNELSKKYGVKLIDMQKDKASKVSYDGYEINICSSVKELDFLINVPVLKGHCQTRMTCALKNIKGLIPNSEKRRFHSLGLHKPISILSDVIKQDFVVVDHICGDLTCEDGGNPVVTNCIMASADPVLIDAYACRVLGLNISDVGYLELVSHMGIGSTDIDNARIITLENASESYTKEMEYIHSDRFVEIRECADEVYSCSSCYAALLPALLRLKDEGIINDEVIAIGQGYKGLTGKIGVGNCTRLFDYYIKGCPPKEEDIYVGLKNYYISRRETK